METCNRIRTHTEISLSIHDIILISGSTVGGSNVSADDIRAEVENLVYHLEKGGVTNQERDLGLVWREAIHPAQE